MQGFEYRNVTGGGDAVIPVKDFDVDATYALTATKGQIVKLSSGKVVLAAPGDTTILGVLEALTYDGPGVTPKKAQVRTAPQAVYEVKYTGTTKTSLTASDIGSSFDIPATADKINLDDTTGGFCKVLKYDNDKGTAHVQLSGLQFA